MSLLNLTKRALSRPVSSPAFIAVGIAFLLLLLHKTRSDREVQQPVTARKMHIKSIPMCESTLYLLNTWLKRKWAAPLLERARRIYTPEAD